MIEYAKSSSTFWCLLTDHGRRVKRWESLLYWPLVILRSYLRYSRAIAYILRKLTEICFLVFE